MYYKLNKDSDNKFYVILQNKGYGKCEYLKRKIENKFTKNRIEYLKDCINYDMLDRQVIIDILQYIEYLEEYKNTNS